MIFFNQVKFLSRWADRQKACRIDVMCPQVKGYRYLEEGNSDESDSERSEEDDENEEDREPEEQLANEFRAEDMEAERQDSGAQEADSLRVRRKRAENH